MSLTIVTASDRHTAHPLECRLSEPRDTGPGSPLGGSTVMAKCGAGYIASKRLVGTNKVDHLPDLKTTC
jgi:hypothetical protein